MTPSSSPTGKINWTDIYKSVRGGLVVFIATFGTLFLPELQKLLETGTFDPPSLLLALQVAFAATMVELGRRYMTNYQK